MHLPSAKRFLLSMIIGSFVIAVTLLGSFLLPTLAHAATGDGSPSDSNINYTGRWNLSTTVADSYWPGAYLQTNFTGQTVKMRLGGAVNAYVSIDGSTDTLYANVSGTVNLTPTPLQAGTHTLRIATRSEGDSLEFEGLILDAGAKTVAPAVSSQLVEFVGDSVTAGATTTKLALSDYAWLIGEQLKVRHTQIAQSGICLVDNVRCGSPNSTGMIRQFFKLQPPAFLGSPNWDFSRYQANVVVINLGTNDNKYGVSDATFQSDYITFLQKVRTVYPHAIILVLRTFKGLKATPTQAAVQAINSAGDSNVHYIDTTGWLTSSDFNDSAHPSDEGHMKVARILGPIIASYLGTGTPTGYVKIVNRNSGLLLDVTGRSTTDGALIQQWQDVTPSSASSEWQLVALSGGYYKIVNRNSGKVLDVTANSKTEGVQIEQWTDNGGANQQWQVVSSGGYVTIVSRSSGLLLDVSGGSKSNGGVVVQWPSDGGANQQWTLVSTT